MKNLRFNVLVLLATPFSITCQNSVGPGTSPSWTSSQLPEETRYCDIVFATQQDGWVVGDSGMIFHSSDGGSTWSRQESGTTLDLNCVSFADSKLGWAGGEKGIILGTTNGGVTWDVQHQPDETTGRILSMKSAISQRGWAGSNLGKILHTSDSGTSWGIQESGTQWAITSISFIDYRRGWAVTAGRELLSTSDAGLHWDVKKLSIRSPIILTDLLFVNENIGWIATNVLASSAIETGTPVMWTTDGGNTWNPQATLPVLDLRALCFLDRNFGWLTGGDRIFSTSDGGLTWLPEKQAYRETFISVSFVDANHGWVLSRLGLIMRYESNLPLP